MTISTKISFLSINILCRGRQSKVQQKLTFHYQFFVCSSTQLPSRCRATRSKTYTRDFTWRRRNPWWDRKHIEENTESSKVHCDGMNVIMRRPLQIFVSSQNKLVKICVAEWELQFGTRDMMNDRLFRTLQQERNSRDHAQNLRQRCKDLSTESVVWDVR